jgi:AAA family ATP:ADP antiporter
MVFNFFVVSVFWSFMADIWREEQGRRLFGAIAAGGSVGGLVGPFLTEILVGRIGNAGVTALAAILLSGTIWCLLRLRTMSSHEEPAKIAKQAAFSGSVWQGFILVLRSPFLLGIAALVLVGTITAQFGYSETARLAKESFSTPEARTAFFANLDFWTNAIALVLQALVVGLLTARFGIATPLVGLAIIGFFAYGALALSPLLSTLAISNIARRSGEFGLGKPARDMLYTVATPQEKYLAKNVIDTVLSRGGDVVAVWIYSGLTLLGVGLAGLGAIAATAMIGAVMVALAVVRGYRRRGGK